MSDLEEAKRLVGKAVGLEPPCFHCMGKGYLTKSMECPKCKGNTLSIMAYVSHIRENANNVLSLLDNMEEGEAERPFNECPECDYLEGHDDICECCENGSNQYVSDPVKEPCGHPPDQQYQVQADILDDEVEPGFYCRLCRKKVSEYGPAEEPKPINRKHPGTECCCPECMAAEKKALPPEESEKEDE